ncbi:calcium-binding protein [Methylorubrum salsuginis]|nr:calcium-binding protein [Methylorubrum salsuginis]
MDMSFLKKINDADDEIGSAFKVNLVKQIVSSKDTVLPANVLNLVLTGKGSINGTGNALDNVITGNAARNMLNGEAGNDRLIGGGGNDSLRGGDGKDHLFGDAGDDFLFGGIGDDWMDGGAGKDWLLGEAGNDRLYGGADADKLSGGDGNDHLYGGAGTDELRGGVGNDWLDGGAGADVMNGGSGSNTYIVDDVGDKVEDYSSGNNEISTVIARVSYDAFENRHIDNITLIGKDQIGAIGNEQDNVITGNAAVNVLQGWGGNDTLIGGAGADRLFGGAGHDSFVFKALSDSPGGRAGHDIIGDQYDSFTRGDRIDLRAIDANTKLAGDQAFTLVKAFGGHAGELQVTKIKGSTDHVLVSADVNGDAKADFAVEVFTKIQLQAGDFLL